MKIARRWKLIVPLTAVLLVAASWTAWNLWTTWDLLRAVGDLRAAGIATSLDELYPPPLPAEDNAAWLYEAAFAFSKNLADPPEGWWDDLPAVPLEVREALPAFGEALDLVHRAAELPACQFDLCYRDGFAMRIAHVPQIRKLGQALVARAAVRAEGGNLEGSQEDLHALFAMTRALRDEPVLVTQLVRSALAKRGLEVLEAVLDRTPSKAQVLDRVRPDDCRGGVSRGLRGDSATCLSLVDGIPEAVLPEPIPVALKVPGLRGPLLKSFLARIARFHLACIRALERPYPEAVNLVSALEEKCAAEGDRLTGLLLAAFSGAVKREAEVVAAVERIRARS